MQPTHLLRGDTFPGFACTRNANHRRYSLHIASLDGFKCCSLRCSQSWRRHRSNHHHRHVCCATRKSRSGGRDSWMRISRIFRRHLASHCVRQDRIHLGRVIGSVCMRRSHQPDCIAGNHTAAAPTYTTIARISRCKFSFESFESIEHQLGLASSRPYSIAHV